ncbi:GAF and ANTAR domain-containing protein [Nocardioides salsibiostraticola]
MGVHALLDRLCLVAVEELAIWGAAVSLMTEGPDGSVPMAVAAASHESAKSVEALHFAHGEGPAREAHRLGRPVLVSDLATCFGRWPGYTTTTRERGVVSVHSYPLGLGAIRLGVLSFYNNRPTTYAPRQIGSALVLVDLAIEILLDTVSMGQGGGGAADDQGSEGLATLVAGDLPASVYQAQGRVMVDHEVSLAEALLRIRAHAFGSGRELSDLADDIVAGRVRLPGAGLTDGG